METLKAIEGILSRVFKRHKFPVSLKAEDETKIKTHRKTYHLWLAVDEKAFPVFMRFSRRRDSHTA